MYANLALHLLLCCEVLSGGPAPCIHHIWPRPHQGVRPFAHLNMIVLLQNLNLTLQSCSLFCADVSERSATWAAPAVIDLPGSHLLRAGYILIASEPCLRLSFSPGYGEEGELLVPSYVAS